MARPARDPFNAKKPMQTFEETRQADDAEQPKVMEAHRRLLESRYNLTPRLDQNAKMARGKPLAVGPTARLASGLEFFNVGLGTKLTRQEKADVVAFLRAL